MYEVWVIIPHYITFQVFHSMNSGTPMGYIYTPVMYKFIILNVLFWHTNLLCIKMFCYIHYYMYTFTWSHLLLEATDFKEAISSKRKPLAPRSEWHRHLQVSSCLVLVIWVHMIRNNPGNAQVCLGLQAPGNHWLLGGESLTRRVTHSYDTDSQHFSPHS